MPGRPHEPTRVHEPRQLVAGEQRLLQRSVTRHLEMLGVREDRFDHFLRIPLFTQDRCAVLWMLVQRRMNLVVEVVEQRDDAPQLLVLAEVPGIPRR